MIAGTALIIAELNAPFQVATVELDVLRLNEVLVQMKASSICATDVKAQQGKFPVPLPAVVGHEVEGAGVVLETGSDVTHVSPGDHVVLSYNYCGRCRHCEGGHMYHCAQISSLNFGGSRPDGTKPITWNGTSVSSCFFGQSSFSNPAVVAAASCVKIDKSLDFVVACSLGCGIQTGAGAIINLVKPVERRTQNLLIFGMGSVGCAAVMAANVMKLENLGVLSRIIVVDVNDERLKVAKELGATHILNSATSNVEKILLELTDNEGVDVAVDCTGVLSVINQMIESIAPGSIAVTVGGTSHGQKASVNIHNFISKCGTYTACHQGNANSREVGLEYFNYDTTMLIDRKFIPYLSDLYQKGMFPLDKLQKKYKPEDINQAIADMASGKVFKPVLMWE
ncbi:hypothetical protein B7463_g11652, partial [Scytalidium lignicola]